MGEPSWWDRITGWWAETGIVCWWKEKCAFEYEPVEGDVPPFEFSHCARCGRAK